MAEEWSDFSIRQLSYQQTEPRESQGEWNFLSCSCQVQDPNSFSVKPSRRVQLLEAFWLQTLHLFLPARSHSSVSVALDRASSSSGSRFVTSSWRLSIGFSLGTKALPVEKGFKKPSLKHPSRENVDAYREGVIPKGWSYYEFHVAAWIPCVLFRCPSHPTVIRQQLECRGPQASRSIKHSDCLNKKLKEFTLFI